ncbi:MAG: hypothetical protein AAGC92_16825 [Pseudomonadota bacterium]
MSVVVNAHFKAKDDQYEKLIATLQAILPDTAKFAGAELISCMANPAEKYVIVHEVWDRKESQEAYIAWRTERGDVDALVAMLRDPPVFEVQEHVPF